jgi:hypothetical protein
MFGYARKPQDLMCAGSQRQSCRLRAEMLSRARCCVCVWVCVFVCVCVCVCVREREREREFVYVFPRMLAHAVDSYVNACP